MNVLVIGLLIGSGIVMTVGDLIMRRWVSNGSNLIYIIGLVVYMVGLVLLSQSYHFKNIAVASLIAVLINIITLLIITWLFYHQGLSVLQIVGVVVGIVAVTILELA
jgi:multidrug transporter EmrE-like cation transporter